MPIGGCATDPAGTGAPFVSDPSDLHPGTSLSEQEHQRVRDRVPRKCGMLQAKATHLFFSEAMTEGTAGNRTCHHPRRVDPQKSPQRAVRGPKETPEPLSPRGQSCHCLCKHRGNHTVSACTADSPRGSVDGTDERVASPLRVRSTTDDRGRTRQRVRGQPIMLARTRGVSAPAPCVTNCSRTKNGAQTTATEEGLRRLRFVVRVGVPTLS